MCEPTPPLTSLLGNVAPPYMQRHTLLCLAASLALMVLCCLALQPCELQTSTAFLAAASWPCWPLTAAMALAAIVFNPPV